MTTKKFINIHVWPKTKDLLTLLAKANNLRLCEYMHRVATALAETEIEPEYRSIEGQDA